jgi:hypothetical protein
MLSAFDLGLLAAGLSPRLTVSDFSFVCACAAKECNSGGEVERDDANSTGSLE